MGWRLHGIRRNLHAESGVQVNAGDGDRQSPWIEIFAKQGAGHGDLRNVADAKGGRPRFCLWETLDEIGLPKPRVMTGLPDL